MTIDSVERPVSPTVHLTVWVLISLFTVILIASIMGRIEIVARGQGKVIPVGQTQVVQPQRPGKIIDILVNEGQLVQKNDLLIALDPTEALADIERTNANILRQRVDAAIAQSIIAALAGKDPANDDFVTIGLQSFLSMQSRDPSGEALVRSVLNGIRDEVRQLDAEIERIERSREVQLSRINGAQTENAIVALKFESSEILQRQGTISRYDYLERSREVKAIENQLTIATGQLAEIAAQANSTAKQRTQVVSTSLATYHKQLHEAEINLKTLSAELQMAQNRLRDTSLRAPITGFIENLSVFTKGGHVEEGATIMSIVPSASEVQIVALFENRDIGFLQPGQNAFIKFDAFPPERFGVLKGKVIGVGADARSDPNSKNWVFAVRLILNTDSIKINGRTIRFTPGMTATIDVITGERRFISYFFEPILKAIQDSFGER